jgi:hypothetical protein
MRLEPTRVTSVHLPCDERAPAGGRRACETLEPIATRPDHLIEAQLVVSELVANAVEHGADPIELRLLGSSWRLRVEVADGSMEPPIPLNTPGAVRLTGRGLVIVDAIAAAWGSRSSDHGKVVWAELLWPFVPPRNGDRSHADQQHG